MTAIERFKEYRDDELDLVMLFIENGKIKCGKFSHRVKIDKKPKVKGKVLFDDNSSE